MIHTHFRLAATLCILGCVSQQASAAGEGPPQPPPQAFAACDGKSSGAACSVKFGERSIEGTCTSHPSEQRLFCMPSGPPPGRPDR